MTATKFQLRILGLGSLWWIALVAAPLSAQTSADTLVTRSLRGRDVLRVNSTVELSQPGPTGAAQVIITGTKPSPADRDLVVVLYMEEYAGYDNNNVAYRVPVRLPEGSTKVELEIPYNSFEGHTGWDIGIFEDGRDIEDRRGRQTGTNWQNATDDTGSVAALISQQEAEASIAQELEPIVRHIGSVPGPNQTIGLPSTQLAIFPVATASSDWRFYFSRPIWIVSAQAVQEVNLRPAVAQALRTYVAAQGLIIVHSVHDTEQLSQVEQLLGISDPQTALGWTTQFAPKDGRMLVNTDQLRSEHPAPLGAHPQLRQYGFGSVLVTAEGLAEMDDTYWQQLLAPVSTHNMVDAEADGDWFWRNLIRSVGKPPVWMFCAIVTLFGAVLGPGLLFFTARLKRRSLMIFLVPLISMIATLAIVSYGVLHEGFETHVRVTSVQAVDTASQQCFVWSRQNYFSGLPPRDGLNFAPQTYARSVSAENNTGYSWDGDPRQGIDSTITLLPDKQNWAGWLKPRQQQQLLVGHAVPFRQLPISIQRSGASQIELANVGPHKLPIVLLRGQRYDYYVAENLAPAETVHLRAESLDIARAKVAKLMVDYRPTSPPELGEGGSLLDFGSGSRRYTAQNNFYQLDDILNNCFALRMSDQLELPPLGFAILTTESDLVEVPLQGKSEENLHLIVGTHAW